MNFLTDAPVLGLFSVTGFLLGLLQIELEEVKKENQNLRSMLNKITEHYAALQNQLLLAMRPKKLSSSPQNNEDMQASLTKNLFHICLFD